MTSYLSRDAADAYQALIGGEQLTVPDRLRGELEQLGLLSGDGERDAPVPPQEHVYSLVRDRLPELVRELDRALGVAAEVQALSSGRLSDTDASPPVEWLGDLTRRTHGGRLVSHSARQDLLEIVGRIPNDPRPGALPISESQRSSGLRWRTVVLTTELSDLFDATTTSPTSHDGFLLPTTYRSWEVGNELHTVIISPERTP